MMPIAMQADDNAAGGSHLPNSGTDDSRRLLRSILENFPNAIVAVMDTDLRHLLIGGRELAENDIAVDLLQGKTLQEILSPDAYAEIEPLFRRAFAGESVEFQYPMLGAVYQVAAVPLERQQGKVVTILAVAVNPSRHLEGNEYLKLRGISTEPADHRVPIGPYYLTTREIEILGYMVQGLTNKQIAARLSRSVDTVNRHVSNVMAKLSARSRTEASVKAIREGLI